MKRRNPCRAAPISMLLAMSMLVVIASPRRVWAYCTFDYNPWAAACEETDGEVACKTLWDAELSDPSVTMHAIPVYLNFDTTTFPIDHPNYPGDEERQIEIHRSLELTGLSREAVTTQVKAAIAQWNQAAAGHPMLYLAGDAEGDSQKVENRPVGITIYGGTCFGRDPGVSARAGTPQAAWTAGDNNAYRGSVMVIPYLHSVRGIAAGSCSSLPDDLNPRPFTVCPEDDPECEPEVDLEAPGLGFDEAFRTSRIRDGFQRVLAHELGHTLGLNHNFFGVEQSPEACGLGTFGTDTFGVMSYEVKYTNLRRDDAMGAHALFGSFLPDRWPMQAWRRLHALPLPADTENTLNGLETSVMPILSNQVASLSGRVALAYADGDHQVRVRTITLGALDPAPGLSDQPLPGEPGKTFTPPAIAMRNWAGAHQQVFVAWNQDSTQNQALMTFWALRDIPAGAWQVFGPLSLGMSDGGIGGGPPGEDLARHHAALGATYDPVFEDYVLATVSNSFRPGITVFDTAGNVAIEPAVLRRSAGPGFPEPVDDYNAVGAPVCIETADIDRSLCLLPIATSGDRSTVGVLAFSRTRAGMSILTGTAREWLARHRNSEAFGHVNLSWNDRTNTGELAYTDERGDVRWLHVSVAASGGVTFSASNWSMEGNGNYAPASLEDVPRDVAWSLQTTWPVCPYWSAASGAVGDDIVAGSNSHVSVVRGLCHGVCGDGFFDGPPWGNEECDWKGQNLGGQTCRDFGFDGGTLMCGPDCNILVGNCTSDPEPDPGDCVEIEQSCIDVEADGCYPDGPGSFGKGGDGNASFGGYYCPDKDGPAVCSFSKPDRQLVPTCIACPEPGSGKGDAGYGCACASDSDCAPTGWASTSGAPNGTEVKLSCFGSTDQGWQAGDGTCMPAIDPAAPQSQTPDPAALEEFERTRWLCKQNCESMEDATNFDHACHYRQGGLDLSYAACVDAVGCKVGGIDLPGGACEESGGACDVETNVCEAQCDPGHNTGVGNPDCAAFGFPSWYSCAHGWVAEGFCVPPECAPDPLDSGLDLSACQQFVNAEVF